MRSVFVLAFTYAIVTAGMAVQIGFSQQIVFSQSVFMGVGAYGVALLNTHWNIPSLLGALIVMLGAGLVALILGSVVTRAAGLALAVVTLMLPLIAVGYISSANYLGGSVGMPLTSSLWNAATPEAIALGNGLITVAVVGAVVFVCSRMLSSDIGLELYVLGGSVPAPTPSRSSAGCLVRANRGTAVGLAYQPGAAPGHGGHAVQFVGELARVDRGDPGPVRARGGGGGDREEGESRRGDHRASSIADTRARWCFQA
ncbi:MAG TPA: hypothetical protein VGF32_02310 [Streptosporangiaceae bacterium]